MLMVFIWLLIIWYEGKKIFEINTSTEKCSFSSSGNNCFVFVDNKRKFHWSEEYLEFNRKRMMMMMKQKEVRTEDAVIRTRITHID